MTSTEGEPSNGRSALTILESTILSYSTDGSLMTDNMVVSKVSPNLITYSENISTSACLCKASVGQFEPIQSGFERSFLAPVWQKVVALHSVTRTWQSLTCLVGKIN